MDNNYSNNWVDLKTILMYKNKSFQYTGDIIITDFDNCLIKNITSAQFYRTRKIELFNINFIKKLKQHSIDKDIIIISNQYSNNKLNIDIIKSKLEAFIETTKINLIAFFCLKKNKLSKPFTGIWKLIKKIYINNCKTIFKTIVVSNQGGNFIEKTNVEYTKPKNPADNTNIININNLEIQINDLDRAFAENCKIKYFSINEYLKPNYISEDFNHELYNRNPLCLDKDHRIKIINKIKGLGCPNANEIVNNIIAKDNKEFIIVLLGPPRCGKTTFSAELLQDWNRSEYGSNHILICINENINKKIIKKINLYLQDRINILIDSNTMDLEIYNNLAKENNINLYYIGLVLSPKFTLLFNYLKVENSDNDIDEILDTKVYLEYRSKFHKPDNIIECIPNINLTDQLLNFRF
jgi:hypothetical protein